MTTIETIRFANDTQTRKRLMVPESFQHPAKGQLGMWATMIERYSQPGDLVLDPMSGSGATLLAALMGRNVICVELEQHFVEPMGRSWEKMRTMPMLGHEMGHAVILRGDARALPLPDASVEAAITSPPWEDKTAMQDMDWIREHDPEIPHHTGTDEFQKTNNRKTSAGYTRPVDAIVTSPPFEEAQSGGGLAITGTPHDPGIAQRIYSKAAMNGSHENIGNMKGQAYWTAQAQVYAECWRVLKPGGILALVLKGFTRDGKYVDLPGQTEALLLEAGWQKHDHWRRELWSLSFWRILQKRRDPAAWDDRLMYEDVLAFRKPEGQGRGIDAVITSPPYEGRLQGDEPAGALFETERRVNSPASGNRKSLCKPLGYGYSKLQARADRVAKAQGPGKRNVFQGAIDNPGAASRRGYGYGYTRKERP